MYMKRRRKMFLLIVLFGIYGFVGVTGSPNGEEYLASLTHEQMDEMPSDIIEDILLDVPQLVEKYGYPIETHEIKTEDGYLITMHRIPGQKVNESGIGSGIPIMMMHGLYGSSSDWIINGPKKSLGYILADLGYDIWLGNARGNYYSRKHVSMNPDKGGKFWQFSWHEIGYYDLPAFIDHILEKTGKQKLHYFGHSQGTTVFFVMASTKPKYNEKIALMQALAPVAYTTHARSPLAQLTNSLNLFLQVAGPFLGIHEFRNTDEVKHYAVHELCNDTSTLFPICTGFIFLISGYSPEELNTTKLPVYVSHAPAGAAVRQQIHYTQVFLSGKFRQFDYGRFKNFLVYGQITPPEYNLTKITAPVAFHYSENDLLADTVDVKRLYQKLPNAVGLFNVPKKSFNHLDFIWAIHAPTLLYDLMRKLLLQY